VLLIRCLCAAYWLGLTVLLLVPNPLGLLGLRRMPGDPEGLCAHLVVFAVLGTLVSATRLPLPRTLLGGLLVGYAVTSELLQSLVGRDTSLRDLLANLVGLAAGAGAWWVVQQYLCRKPDTRG
jgi:VanZ family protein